MAASQIKKYIYVHQSMNWNVAKAFCRQNYEDLASITSEEDNQKAVKVGGQNTFGYWIGLNRTAPHADTWQWSDGENPTFTKWMKGEPNNFLGKENCAVISPYGWVDTDCQANCPFICYKKFMLMKEKKTWEDALEYCRSNCTDLAFLDSKRLLELFEAEPEPVNVWTGLRFLNGKWIWVNGTLGSLVSLPSCPVQPYRCGAYNFKIYIWENRDCNEELNFLCNY